jgi:hypothetical protein
MSARVPDHYIGVWQRERLKRSNEPWDLNNQVYWLQTPRWHADVRVPHDRPDFSGVTSLAQCNDAQLHALLKQESFCGITVVDDDICRWVRQIDVRLRETNDFGRMRFEADMVEEFGIEIDSYEIWRRLPGTLGESYALERVPTLTAGDDSARAVLCVAGDRFIYTRNRPMWAASAVRARSQIALGKAPRAELEAFLDFEGSFGTIVDGVGRITMSTLPWRQGEVAFSMDEIDAARHGTYGTDAFGWRPIG